MRHGHASFSRPNKEFFEMQRKSGPRKSNEASYIPRDWRQPGEVGINFGAFLQLQKSSSSMVKSGLAGNAIARAPSSDGDVGRANVFFQRGGKWAADYVISPTSRLWLLVGLIKSPLS